MTCNQRVSGSNLRAGWYIPNTIVVCEHRWHDITSGIIKGRGHAYRLRPERGISLSSLAASLYFSSYPRENTYWVILKGNPDYVRLIRQGDIPFVGTVELTDRDYI